MSKRSDEKPNCSKEATFVKIPTYVWTRRVDMEKRTSVLLNNPSILFDCLLVSLTFNIHHSEISFLTLETFEPWKPTQTLQINNQLMNQSVSQSVSQSVCVDPPAVLALQCLQVNLFLLSSQGALEVLEVLGGPGHPQDRGHQSVLVWGHKNSCQDTLKQIGSV